MKITMMADEQITVDLGGGDSATWHIGRDVPKPYIHPVTLAGQPVTLASPHDHVHHRGAMFAMKVDDVNYWEEGPESEFGVQIVKDVRDLSCRRDEVKFTLHIDWIPSQSKNAQINEQRSFLVSRPQVGGVMITWTSRLSAVPGQGGSDGLRLSGETPHAAVSYYGLGVRFQRAMDWGGHHQNSQGVTGVDGTHGHRAAWHDFSGPLDETGSVVGLALFDHPSNPRHPSEWFVMQQPFAYVSASLVATENVTLTHGEPIVLNYGLWAHQGQVSQEGVETAYQEWLKR